MSQTLDMIIAILIYKKLASTPLKPNLQAIETMWNLTQKEFQSVSKLENGARAEYAVKRFADNRLVWLLASGPEEWCLVEADDGRECVPIWPHERFAEACCIEEFASAKPKSVPVDEFAHKWLSGMAKDGRYVAVFPVPGMRGVVVEPYSFEALIMAELAKY